MHPDQQSDQDWQKIYDHLAPKGSQYWVENPSLKQKLFLMTKQREVLFGGSAGGGKSSALLMAALQYVDIPGYSAIMFRRTYSDLALPGALMDRFKDWMAEYPDVTWNNNSYTATFPSGARVTFGYLNNVNDKLRYKGSEFQFCVAGDTLIKMADGSSKQISKIEPGVDYAQTLEGPRLITKKWHVGEKPAVSVTTQSGTDIVGLDHKMLTPDGSWVSPMELYATLPRQALSSASTSEQTHPALQELSSDSTLGLVQAHELSELNRDLGLIRETCAWSRDDQSDYEWSGDSLRAIQQLPVLSVHLMLHGLDHRTEASAFAGSAQQGAYSHDRDHSSAPNLLHSSELFDGRYGAPLPSIQGAVLEHTPSLDGAASQFQLLSLVGDLGSTQSHSQMRPEKLYHPYTNLVMETQQDVQCASAEISPAGVQDLWDIRVEGSSHYISTTSSIVQKNCGFDEVTEIRQDDYLYLFSRLRQPATGPLSQIPLRMRATTNPAPNWVRQRFIVEGREKKRLFIPSSLEDNPGINIESYRETLSELDPVERKRLEFGDWWASSLGSMFSREDFTILEDNELPEFDKTTTWVRFWDLAGTKPSQSNPDPDWSVGCLSAFHNGVCYIMDVTRFREDGDQVERHIKNTAIDDGSEVPVRMEQEPGSAGKNLLDQYARYVLPGYDFTGVRATGSKEVRAKPMASALANGNVRLKMGAWNTDFIDELSQFPEGGSSVHDDQVDSAVHAFNYIAGLNGGMRRKIEIII